MPHRAPAAHRVASGVLRLLLLVTIARQASAAEPLFPEALHLTRQFHDPITGRVSAVEEYCLGNRVVSIAGAKTSIADYDRNELTVIDRRSATYSVTPFSAIAQRSGSTHKGKAAPRVERVPGTSASSRSGDAVEVEMHGRRTRLFLDSELTVSRDAFDVLTGASFPNTPAPEAEAIATAARIAGSDRFALPLDQTVRYSFDGETVEVRTAVTRVGREAAPAESVAIPPGAQRVESDWIARERLLHELDQSTSRVPKE